MYLFVSTIDNNFFHLAIGDRGKIMHQKIIKKPYQQSELLISEIEKILNNQKPMGIIVDQGPGAFSALRIGVATVNALAFAWGIKIVGVDHLENLGEMFEFGMRNIKKIKRKNIKFVDPIYGGGPNIGGK